jgi:hypothetical protein
LKVTNRGQTAVRVTSVSVTGDFAQTNTCGTSLAARDTCTISVTFEPTATGKRTGKLSLKDNATNSPQVANLRGKQDDRY